MLKFESKGTGNVNGGVQYRSYLTADNSVLLKYPGRGGGGFLQRTQGAGDGGGAGGWRRSGRPTSGRAGWERSGTGRARRGTRAAVRESRYAAERGRARQMGHGGTAVRLRRQQYVRGAVL